MRNLRKLTAVVIAIALVLTSMSTVFAVEPVNGEEAITLNELGLYEGVSTTEFDPDLESDLTREQATILLLKMFGLKDEAAALTDEDVALALEDKTDADKVHDWAAKAVAYAVANEIMSGKSATTVNPLDKITGAEFATLILKTMGYEVADWKLAVTQLSETEGSMVADEFADENLTRDAAVGYMYGALTAVKADGETVIASIVGDDEDLKAIAEAAGLIEAPAAVALDVKSASAVTSAKIKVILKTAATQADVDAAKISFADKDAKAVAVKSATIAADGKSFIIVTDAMTAGALYKLTIGDVTKSIVGLPADTTKPSVDTANSVVKTNTSFEVKFNEKVDDVTATNVANYSIDNGLTVLKATVGDDGQTITLTTTAQTVGTIYKLTIKNVTDFSGNAMSETSVLFGGMAPDTDKPEIVPGSTVVDGNTSFTVKFDEKVSAETATNIANYTFDNGLTCLKAELNKDADTVTLTTSAQTVGTIYKLTIQNVADLSGNVMDKKEVLFGGMAPDTDKPEIVPGSTVVTTNTQFKVVFDEKVSNDTATNIANYTLDNGLTVLKAELADDAKTVTLTTSAQTVGTIYKLTIQNVADIAGNVMDKKEVLFGGMAVDTVAPTVASVTSGDKKVYITFGEALSTDLATELGNYAFDGGLGYPLSAELSTDGTVVTLTTLAQTPAKVYNVTINNVTDLSGNVIAKDTKKSFLGSGSVSAAQVKVQAISIVNNNTFDVIFDSEISNTDLGTLAVTINKENGAAYTAPAGLAYEKVRQDDKKIVRFQFKVTGNTNPEIFKNGKYYEATVTGVTNLVTTDSANVKNFAGTSVANVAPYVAAVTPVNKNAVKVTFSEPVKGIGPGFTINNGMVISGYSVVDSNKIVTEVLVYLSTNLEQGAVYKLSMGTSPITDAAGIMGLKKLNSDNSAYEVSFAGTSVANSAPKMQAVVATDKYNFDVIFTEEVTGADVKTKYSVAYTEGGVAKTLDLSNANIAIDGAKVTIKLVKGEAELKSGIAYTLTLDKSGIADLQGLAYDTTTDANKVVFGGTDAANAVPEIVGVEATVDGTIKVVFSENVTVTGAAVSDVFEITGAGYVANAGDTYTVDGKTVTIDLANTLTSSAIGSIKVKTASAVKDINGQDAKTDAISFGAK